MKKKQKDQEFDTYQEPFPGNDWYSPLWHTVQATAVCSAGACLPTTHSTHELCLVSEKI